MGELKVYNGSTWDVALGKVYNGSVWKEKMSFYDGADQIPLYPTAACTAGTSAIPDMEDQVAAGPPAAEVGGKWDSDGDVYDREGGSSWGASSSTWQGSCAVGDYEGRWIKNSGDNPTGSSGTANTWHDMTSDVMVEYVTPADDVTLTGTFTFELRRKADQVLILTDAFEMTAIENAEP